MIPISCQSEGALEVYVEPVLASPHLVDRRALADGARRSASLARDLGWRADLIDGRRLHAGRRRIGRTVVIVATQGHGDEDALEHAVAGQPAYLGLVGSRRRGRAVLGYLADRGVPRDQLDRVRVPVGLDLGPHLAPEIAVAILAELVQLRASGALGRGHGAASPRGSGQTCRRRADRPGLRDDRVRGLASRPLRHDGIDLLLLLCRLPAAFEQDPAAYLTKETRC